MSGEVISQPACAQRSRDDVFDAPPVEWNDEEEVNLSEPVVYGTNGRHDHTGAGSPKFPKDGQPKVQVRVVSASNEFVVSYAENRPGTDGVANLIGLSSSRRHDFCFSRYRESTPLCESISKYQGMLDPTWMMAKDAEEDFDDACGWWCQWCPVGIAEVGFGDESGL